MNLAIFLESSGVKDFAPLAKRLAALQHTTVNGCLYVVHSSHLPKQLIHDTLGELPARFVTSGSLPVQVNNTLPQDARIAQMFGRFLLSGYSLFPGPWLMFDEPAEPKAENFMQAVSRQHGAHGGRMTGRFEVTPGAARPIGPVTLELSQQDLKFLRYGISEGWRSRGRYLFGRSGYGQISPAEWLFSMKAAAPAVLERPSGEPSTSDLFDLVEKKTGKRPHHFTGRDKLLAMAFDNNTAI